MAFYCAGAHRWTGATRLLHDGDAGRVRRHHAWCHRDGPAATSTGAADGRTDATADGRAGCGHRRRRRSRRGPRLGQRRHQDADIDAAHRGEGRNAVRR